MTITQHRTTAIVIGIVVGTIIEGSIVGITMAEMLDRAYFMFAGAVLALLIRKPMPLLALICSATMSVSHAIASD